MLLTGTAGSGNRPDDPHIGRVHFTPAWPVYQGLAVRGLAQREAYCAATPTFLGYRGVVDDAHVIATADGPIQLNKQFCLHRRRIPDPGGNKRCD